MNQTIRIAKKVSLFVWAVCLSSGLEVSAEHAKVAKSAKDTQDNEKLLPAFDFLLAISEPVLLVIGMRGSGCPHVGG